MRHAPRFIVLCLLLLQLAAAQTMAAVPVIPDSSRISLDGHVFWLQGQNHPVDIQEVDGPLASRFIPLHGALDAGFSDSAIWLRFEIVQLEKDQSWILSLPSPLIAQVKLYQQEPGGRWAVQESGEDHFSGPGDIGRLTPAFRLDLTPGRHRIYLLLASHTPLVTSLEIWEPLAFMEARLKMAIGEGLYFGAYALLLLMQVGTCWLVRDQRSFWYLAYTAVNAAIATLTVGWLRLFWIIPSHVSDKLLGTSIGLGLAVSTHVLFDLLDIKRWQPYLTRSIQQLGWFLAAVSTFFVLTDQYAIGAPIAQASIIGLLLFIFGDLVWLAWHGRRAKPLQVLAVGLFAIGVILRLLRNLGTIEPGAFTDNAYRVALLMHLLVMGGSLIQRYRRLHAEQLRSQELALQATRTLNASLDAAVEQRTSALQMEVQHSQALEHELRRSLIAEQQARQIQNDFFAMVSHEFRTPLAIIDTAIQQLEGDPEAPPEVVRQRYEHANAAVIRMTSLMDDYLSLDRLQNENRVPYKVAFSIQDLLKAAQAEWPEGRVHLAVLTVPMTLTCDPDLLAIAVRNLLANADRYTPRHQQIELRAWTQDGNQVCISVLDTGPGIPVDELPRVFSKYFRGRSARHLPGSGLGLHLVQRITELHQGSVAVSSEPGQGTCFTMTLPMAL